MEDGGRITEEMGRILRARWNSQRRVCTGVEDHHSTFLDRNRDESVLLGNQEECPM